MSNGTILLIECRHCHKIINTGITVDEYEEHVNSGKFIQASFPDMSPAIREMFISQTCGECWDKLFRGDE